MSTIKVALDKMVNEDDVTKALCQEMKRLAEKLENCQKYLGSSMNGTVYDSIGRRMSKLHQQILGEAVQMDTFQGAIEKVAECYRRCEIELTELVDGETDDGSGLKMDSQVGTDKRNSWQKFWDKIFRRKLDDKYRATTSEKEAAADRAMQGRISSLMNSGKYSQSRWVNATANERRQMLMDYMHEVEAIMGVSVRSYIDFFNEGPSADGKITMGSFTSGNDVVHINSYVIEKYNPRDSYSLFKTVVHELRHAYQHAAIRQPTKYQVSKETIDRWKESFAIYEREQAKGYEYYLALDVECDARRFAGQG